MSSRRNSLSPPSPSKPEKEDRGAHELASDSEDHFSDAQSGPAESIPASPIPRTRVERVDDKPAYGEVPGTKAYSLREEDATPDEIAFVPDVDSKPASESEQPPRSPTPGGHPIPKTVVEESPDSPTAVSHAEKTEHQQKHHRADPPPDIIVKADGQKVENGGGGGSNGDAEADTPMSATSSKTPVSPRLRRKKSSSSIRPSPMSPSFPSNIGGAGGDGDDEGGGGGDDDFGDDFDDFEEGDEDADFDDFEDGFQQAEQISAPEPTPAPAPPQPQQPALSFPIPNLTDIDDPSEIFSITEPYLQAIFPSIEDLPDPLPLPAPSRDTNPIFLTPRSASLWSQLVAPPPLQPPDWIRSRIRRLFLVSLGVPVDLDEILPASKQKKLVLPSLLHKVSSTGSLRTSTDTPSGSRSLSRVRASGNNASSTSVDSQGNLKLSRRERERGEKSSLKENTASASASSRKGPPPEPNLDLVSAKQLCMTTDEALGGMTDSELKAHVAKLEAMQGTAHELLVYWQARTDEKIGDREAFEGVIENLVKHARKTRK